MLNSLVQIENDTNFMVQKKKNTNKFIKDNF